MRLLLLSVIVAVLPLAIVFDVVSDRSDDNGVVGSQTN